MARLAALLFIVVLVVPAAAQRPQHVGENYTMPVIESVFNDCTGETVELNGNVHVQYHAHEMPDGFRAEAASNYANVSGRGTASGATYRMVGTHKSQVDFRRPFPSRSMLNLTVRLIRQGGGKGANSHVQIQVRYTADGNGRITSEIERMTLVCR